MKRDSDGGMMMQANGRQAEKQQVVKLEWLKSRASAVYFVNTYVQIYNATTRGWLPFVLWPRQAETLERLARTARLVILKARQLGISWLCLAYALWLLVLRGPSTVLLFSLREAEAKELLARLRGMYVRLPVWMQARTLVQDSATALELSTGSRGLAFSTRSGRSYTGTLALVDEADFIPDLGYFLNGVKPTIDGGGQLFLVSTSDKTRPVSTFKNLFRAANPTDAQGASGPKLGRGPTAGEYESIFLPWHAHPGRDAAWHARTKAEMFAQRGTDDDFLAEYPATAAEALAPEQLDRRLPLAWVLARREESEPLDAEAQRRKGTIWPALPGLLVYEIPKPGKWYVIGADPAEGNPNSDASAATVVDGESWAEVASLVGRFEPSLFAQYLADLAAYFNDAGILVERNNHGHSVLRALASDGRVPILNGYDGRPGWLNTVKGKPLLYSLLADALRDGVCVVRSDATANQLASIQASNLRAPAGLSDDQAMSFALAIGALAYGGGEGQASTVAPPVDVIGEGGGW